jgi:hypothetical protein
VTDSLAGRAAAVAADGDHGGADPGDGVAAVGVGSVLGEDVAVLAGAEGVGAGLDADPDDEVGRDVEDGKVIRAFDPGFVGVGARCRTVVGDAENLTAIAKGGDDDDTQQDSDDNPAEQPEQRGSVISLVARIVFRYY